MFESIFLKTFNANAIGSKIQQSLANRSSMPFSPENARPTVNQSIDRPTRTPILLTKLTKPYFFSRISNVYPQLYKFNNPPLNYNTQQTGLVPKKVFGLDYPKTWKFNTTANKNMFNENKGLSKDTTNSVNWTPQLTKATNIDGTLITVRAAQQAATLAGSYLGVPQVAQIAQSADPSGIGNRSVYNTGPAKSMKPIPGIKYADFRSRLLSNVESGAMSLRLDGTSAAFEKNNKGKVNYKAIAYAAASATVGAYSIFNIENTSNLGYGWGDHDNPFALRNDFTAKSHIATRWDKDDEIWKPTRNPAALVTPFRGDKVNVIDFGQRKLTEAYLWNPKTIGGGGESPLGAFKPSMTQDFIKFYFTGPKLQAGNTDDKDDIMVFRATIGQITDTFSPSWNPVNMVGRADPNYHYTGMSRSVTFDFDVYATDRDELKPIWRKLNALVGYTAPTYNPNNIAMEGSWMRFTLGDLYVQQPAIMDSCTVSLAGDDVSWEINIENDGTNMQLPLKFNVSISLKLVTDWLPQKGGRFYSLAKQFEADATPIAGNDDWLSDTKTNKSIIEQQQDFDS